MWDVVVWNNKSQKKEEIDYIPSCWQTAESRYKWPQKCSTRVLQTLIDTCDPLIGHKYKEYNVQVKKRQLKTLEEAQYYCDKGMVQSNIEETTENEVEQTDAGSSSSSSSGDEREEERRGSNSKKYKAPTKLTQYKPTEKPLIKPTSHVTAESSESSGPLAADLPSLTAFQQIMLKKINSLQYDVSTTKREIRGINSRLTTIEKQLTSALADNTLLSREVTTNQVFTVMAFKNMPFETEVAFLEANEALMEEKNMTEMIQILYLCGGQNWMKAVQFQMKKIMKNDIAVLYSGEGKQKKKSFRDLNFFKAILQAVRRRFTETTDADIKRVVSAYLAGAKDRDGGRVNRGRKRNRDEENDEGDNNDQPKPDAATEEL